MRKIGLSLILLVALPATLHATSLDLVNSNGTFIDDIPAVEDNDSFLVDLKDFFQAIDFSVEWKSSLQRLEVAKDDKNLRFMPRVSHVMNSDGRLLLSNEPILEDHRVFLAVESIERVMNRLTNQSVFWNATRTQIQLQNSENWSSNKKSDPIGQFIEKTPREESKKVVVMIDPGHGGRDPGAIGSSGLQEKKVVLEMGLELKRVLNENYPSLKPKLSRQTDKFIPLKGRTQMANEIGADIFISLHANSGYTREASGFEVFTLSGEATDPSARDLAKIENSALRYEGYDEQELDEVSWILWQLRSTVHTRESRKMANEMVDELKTRLSVNSRGMKQAPFWVLKDARMPAALVETGFLSNPAEEKKLKNTAYQQKIAQGLAEALKKFVTQRSGS